MFSRPDVSVVAGHLDTGWAVIIVASRKQNGRRIITPFIVAREDCDLFASCPNAELWARAGYITLLRTRQLTTEQATALFDNALLEVGKQIASVSHVLEESATGMFSGWRNWAYGEAIHNFEMEPEPAFRWLLDLKDRNNGAFDALRICRALAEKHKLHESTHEEKAAAAERKLTNQKLGGY